MIIDCFDGLTPEEYERQTKEHCRYLEHMSKADYKKSCELIEKFKENIFALELVSQEEAETLYHTILNWKDHSDMYDDLCGIDISRATRLSSLQIGSTQEK